MMAAPCAVLAASTRDAVRQRPLTCSGIAPRCGALPVRPRPLLGDVCDGSPQPHPPGGRRVGLPLRLHIRAVQVGATRAGLGAQLRVRQLTARRPKQAALRSVLVRAAAQAETMDPLERRAPGHWRPCMCTAGLASVQVGGVVLQALVQPLPGQGTEQAGPP